MLKKGFGNSGEDLLHEACSMEHVVKCFVLYVLCSINNIFSLLHLPGLALFVVAHCFYNFFITAIPSAAIFLERANEFVGGDGGCFVGYLVDST